MKFYCLDGTLLTNDSVTAATTTNTLIKKGNTKATGKSTAKTSSTTSNSNSAASGSSGSGAAAQPHYGDNSDNDDAPVWTLSDKPAKPVKRWTRAPIVVC
jgi:hypothetical protein